jgi:hypothetical protein
MTKIFARAVRSGGSHQQEGRARNECATKFVDVISFFSNGTFKRFADKFSNVGFTHEYVLKWRHGCHLSTMRALLQGNGERTHAPEDRVLLVACPLLPPSSRRGAGHFLVSGKLRPRSRFVLPDSVGFYDRYTLRPTARINSSALLLWITPSRR